MASFCQKRESPRLRAISAIVPAVSRGAVGQRRLLCAIWMDGAERLIRPDVLQKLSTPPQGIDDPFLEMRRQIFYSFRDPASTVFEPLKWPPIYGDALATLPMFRARELALLYTHDLWVLNAMGDRILCCRLRSLFTRAWID